MTRPLIFILAGYYGINGAYLLLLPRHFYDHVPGVVLSGPYNPHFIADIGLIFLVSAAALGWAGWAKLPGLALFGGGWPLLHGLFHLRLWLTRGLPLDRVAASDWLGVILPALLVALAAYRLKEARA